MVKRWFCLATAVLTANLMLSGCATTREVDMTGYMPENIELIDKNIKEKNAKTPVAARNKEVVLHITQGPIAGGIGGMKGLSHVYRGVDLGTLNEDEQEDLLYTKENDLGSSRLIARDYSKALVKVLEKQLGRYFSKVSVADSVAKGPASGGIGIKSIIDLYEVTATVKKATVTVTATLPGGAPISVTRSHEITHMHPMALLPLALLFPIGTLIVSGINTSIMNRTQAAVLWIAMNGACEDLSSQLATRIAKINDRIIEIDVAITGLETR